MAQIYVGNRAKVDDEILEAVKTLTDDYFVFAEFDGAGRNIDWLICQAVEPHQAAPLASRMILTEVKRTTRPLRGGVDGVWEKYNGRDDWEPITGSNGEPANYYRQVVDAVNTLNDYLWNNQRVFLRVQTILPSSAFGAWPDLLILSPAGILHQTPLLRAANNFGQFYYSIGEWLAHIQKWQQQDHRVRLSSADLRNLAQHLRLQHIWPPPPQKTPVAGTAGANVDMLTLYAELESRVATLEGRAVRLEGQVQNLREQAGLTARLAEAVARIEERLYTVEHASQGGIEWPNPEMVVGKFNEVVANLPWNQRKGEKAKETAGDAEPSTSQAARQPNVRVEYAVVISRTIDDVFAYVTNIALLPRWVSEIGEVTRETDEPLDAGTRLQYRTRFLFVPVPRTAELVAYVAPTDVGAHLNWGLIPVDIHIRLTAIGSATRVAALVTANVLPIAQGFTEAATKRDLASNLRTLKGLLERGDDDQESPPDAQ